MTGRVPGGGADTVTPGGNLPHAHGKTLTRLCPRPDRGHRPPRAGGVGVGVGGVGVATVGGGVAANPGILTIPGSGSGDSLLSILP